MISLYKMMTDIILDLKVLYGVFTILSTQRHFGVLLSLAEYKKDT